MPAPPRRPISPRLANEFQRPKGVHHGFSQAAQEAVPVDGLEERVYLSPPGDIPVRMHVRSVENDAVINNAEYTTNQGEGASGKFTFVALNSQGAYAPNSRNNQGVFPNANKFD